MTQTNPANEIASYLRQSYPNASPEELLAIFQATMLEGIEGGIIAAFRLPSGDIEFVHTEWCSAEEWARRMTPQQYRGTWGRP